MHLIVPPPFRTASKLLAHVRIALFLMITATLPLPAAHASATPPPHYPDHTHVYNGCRLSALAYLAKFTAEFPSEHGQPLVLSMRNADGQVRPHTLAVITWRGEWWCRDEYFGVFSLKCAADGTSDPERLTAIAERLYERHAQDVLRQPNAQLPPVVPAQLSTAQRLRDVQNATALIPVPHMIYWIRDGRREVPVVFFVLPPARSQSTTRPSARAPPIAPAPTMPRSSPWSPNGSATGRTASGPNLPRSPAPSSPPLPLPPTPFPNEIHVYSR